MTTVGAAQLYKTLGGIGLKKNQVRALLPDWWDDDVASSEVGTWEMITLLSRRLSIDAKGLSNGEIMPIGSATKMAYKHRSSTSADQYKASSLIAGALAHAVLAAMPTAFSRFENAPAQIRELIQQRQGGIVDFDGLLEFCWSAGIPVIPLPHLPIGVRKMDGAVLLVNGRPAIVIARRNDSRSWLSFILAHELGHYCCGHLADNSTIIDVELKSETTYQAESSADIQEREADAFALELLGGKMADKVISHWSARATGVELAVNAREGAVSVGASAGHLVLRHAFRTKRWPEAQAGLKFLDEDFDAQQKLTESLRDSIDLTTISEDLQGLVGTVTGISGA